MIGKEKYQEDYVYNRRWTGVLSAINIVYNGCIPIQSVAGKGTQKYNKKIMFINTSTVSAISYDLEGSVRVCDKHSFARCRFIKA